MIRNPKVHAELAQSGLITSSVHYARIALLSEPLVASWMISTPRADVALTAGCGERTGGPDDHPLDETVGAALSLKTIILSPTGSEDEFQALERERMAVVEDQDSQRVQ